MIDVRTQYHEVCTTHTAKATPHDYHMICFNNPPQTQSGPWIKHGEFAKIKLE